jgi:hypothetical protein
MGEIKMSLMDGVKIPHVKKSQETDNISYKERMLKLENDVKFIKEQIKQIQYKIRHE